MSEEKVYSENTLRIVALLGQYFATRQTVLDDGVLDIENTTYVITLIGGPTVRLTNSYNVWQASNADQTKTKVSRELGDAVEALLT